MSLEYYLGANTPEGFVSCFPGMTDHVSRLYIIKGGPGCGKSTAMKCIAAFCEEAGMEAERIWCSSDADSLDGIYLPRLDTMYVDGTAPHVVEPSCPGARDGIVDFGNCWDEDTLAFRREEIENAAADVSACYQRAYGFLRAAGVMAAMLRQDAEKHADPEQLQRRTARIGERCIPARHGQGRGRQIDIFLNALTPQGPSFLDSFSGYEVCILSDSYGLYPHVTGPVLEQALQAGFTVYAAHDPLFPHGAPLHLVIPELRFALLTDGGFFGCGEREHRRIHLDRMLDSGWGKPAAVRKRREYVICREALEGAMCALGEAKRMHDVLEALYRPAVDFSKVDRLTKQHCTMLLRRAREQ